MWRDDGESEEEEVGNELFFKNYFNSNKLLNVNVYIPICIC